MTTREAAPRRSAPLGFASRHPRLGAALGAIAISQSSPLAKLSGGSPAAVTLYRGVFALPFLAFIAHREGHRASRRDRALALVAGGLFALDLQCFHTAIPLLGATVSGRIEAYRYLVESIEGFPDQRAFAAAITAAGIAVTPVNKVTEGRPHVVDMIKNNEIALIVNTVEEAFSIFDRTEIDVLVLDEMVFEK